jgi:hypothetical protein
VAFPHEWWAAVEVAYAVSSFGDGDYEDALKAWRKSQIGRKAALRARDFDNAQRGVRTSMAGQPQTIESVIQRALWYVRIGVPPCFARPAGWTYSDRELEVIAIARAHDLEPTFLAYDTTGIDAIPGPATKHNPWNKWRKT